MRTVLMSLGLIAFMIGLTGCGSGQNAPRNDMPIKTTQGVDKKTGKPAKTLEASLEDPSAGGKK